MKVSKGYSDTTASACSSVGATTDPRNRASVQSNGKGLKDRSGRARGAPGAGCRIAEKEGGGRVRRKAGVQQSVHAHK